MRDVSLRQWRSFVCIARHASFARAAEELCITPSALTQQIREMEASLGLPLFDRSNRGVELTVTGEYLLVHGKRLLATVREAESVVAKLRRLETGRVAVGAVNTAKYFVPTLMMAFRELHPDIEIRLAVEDRTTLLRQLDEGDYDVVVMGRPPKEYALRAEAFAANPHGFVARPDRVARHQFEPAMLAGLPMIVRERGTGTRGLFDRYCETMKITPHIALEARSNETVKQAVLAGMGVGFLSLHTVGSELPGGSLRLLAVDGTPVMRKWHCVHQLGRTLSPIAEAFRYFLLEHGERVLATKYHAINAALAAEASR